ncbi:tetratricopeptide repeat protein [Kordia sp.]|uniref:tetratricopeptide repeat protein n=1 Tax=Kordia sp. TaxID=1965332 RepID=UPI003B5B35C9
MEDEETIKNKARAEFEQKKYEEAFTILLKELDIASFFKYIDADKRQWVTDKHFESATYFWKKFVLQEENFQKLFSSNIAVELLYNYYSNSTIFIKAFEIKLSEQFPELFVHVIRVNQVFFKKERLDFLLEEIQLPENLELHQDVWELFYQKEIELWQEIESSIEAIVNYSLENILQSVVAYIEKKSYEFDSRAYNIQLGSVYSFFMELLLKQDHFNISNLSESEDFFKSFVEGIHNEEESNLNKLISNIFDLIYSRTLLLSNFIDPYSFESDTSPELIYETLYFVTKPQASYRWKLDGIRYDSVDLFYRKRGSDFLEEKIKNNQYSPIGITKEHLELNKTLQEKIESVFAALHDLELNEYYYTKNETISVSEIVPPIFAFAYNRLLRYKYDLDEVRNSNSHFSKSWKMAFAWLNLQSTRQGVAQMPFIYMTLKEYEDLNKKASSDFDRRITEILIESFSEVINKKETFDRFDTQYDVFAKPFLRFKDRIFCSVQFFTSFSYMYVYVNALINNNGRKTAKKIEPYLGKLLKVHGLHVFIPNKAEEKKMKGNGDADVVLYNDHHVLLMQLKRTYLRLNPKDVYNEYLKTDRGGAKQLNEIEKFFNSKNDVFEIKNRKVTKWIVSSSLENVNRVIEGCLKVNYMDIVCFLLNNEGMTFKTLEDFIGFYSEDFMIKTYVETVNESFVIQEIDKCRIPFIDFNVDKANKYRDFFNKGMDLNRKKKNKQSIEAFKKCLYYENGDVEVHGAIANVYADIKDYKNAFYHFEKALELLPSDPFITRNYIGALAESGNFTKAKELMKILVEKYPLLKDVQEMAKHILR